MLIIVGSEGSFVNSVADFNYYMLYSGLVAVCFAVVSHVFFYVYKKIIRSSYRSNGLFIYFTIAVPIVFSIVFGDKQTLYNIFDENIMMLLAGSLILLSGILRLYKKFDEIKILLIRALAFLPFLAFYFIYEINESIHGQNNVPDYGVLYLFSDYLMPILFVILLITSLIYVIIKFKAKNQLFWVCIDFLIVFFIISILFMISSMIFNDLISAAVIVVLGLPLIFKYELNYSKEVNSAY